VDASNDGEEVTGEANESDGSDDSGSDESENASGVSAPATTTTQSAAVDEQVPDLTGAHEIFGGSRICDLLGFPKPKILMARLDYVINVVRHPELHRRHHPEENNGGTSGGSSATQTSMRSFTSTDGGPADWEFSDTEEKGDNNRSRRRGSRRRGGDNGNRRARRRGTEDGWRRCIEVPRHPNNEPVLPITIGVLHVHALGRVIWRNPAFHNDRYIWPVGFRSSRSYSSVIDPYAKCLYHCEIRDDQGEPVFVVTPQDDPDHPAIAASASAAWTAILKRVNSMKTAATGRRLFTAVSGPEYFGYSNATIAQLIQV